MLATAANTIVGVIVNTTVDTVTGVTGGDSVDSTGIRQLPRLWWYIDN